MMPKKERRKIERRPAGLVIEPPPPRAVDSNDPSARLFQEAKRELEAQKNAGEAAVTPVVTPVSTGVSTPVDTPVTIPVTEERQPYLDATHSASEKSVYSVMYREAMRNAARERHFGFKELSSKTGIRSDTTIRRAVDGLIAKLSIEIISYFHGNPLGPRYRIYEPKEIMRRRKDVAMEIDLQSKRITTPVATGVTTGVKTYGSTPVETTPVTPVEVAGDINKENSFLNKQNFDDDAALAGLAEALKTINRELTGKELSRAEADRWRELADVLIAELKIAAARTTVSSVPSFLAEHLRRRLWKLDKKQARAEGRELPDEQMKAKPAVDSSKCPDCGGSGWWYPDGTEKGVARCQHANLQKGSPKT